RTEELSESLQQQTATADVLKVISRSTFDLKSVLQTLVESAGRLCGADYATITRQKDGVLFFAEAYGYSSEFIEYCKAMPVERAQVAIPRQHEPRAARPAQRHHRPDGDDGDERGALRHGKGAGAAAPRQCRREPPPEPDQRDPRPLEDRSRQARTQSRACEFG